MQTYVQLEYNGGINLHPKAKTGGIWKRQLPDEAAYIPVKLDGRRTRILQDLSLEITTAWEKDSGIYICFRGWETMAHYALDVKKTEPHRYIVMSGKRKRSGQSEDLPLKDLNLVIGMQWSEWSQCNRCGDVGRRRRVGICMVRKLDPLQPTKPVDTELLNEYRKGLPCRSSLLPKGIRELAIVYNSKTEFVIGFCKIPCPSEASIVIITDESGKVVDTVDNSKGIYSMQQPLPDLPPLVKRKIVYQEVGKCIIMACPGNVEGKFLIWRNDSFVINPSKVHVLTKGRVKIDIGNNLHIRKLRFSDTAIYSCWDDKRLVGTIRLQVVEEQVGQSYRTYMLNTGVVFTFLIILMIAVTVGRNIKLTKE